MNILSISQVQNQNPQSDFTILPIQTEKSSETEKASFSDFLKDAKKADDKIQSENPEKVAKDEKNEGEKVSKNDENLDSKKIAEKTEDKNSPKEEKSEKIAKKSSKDEKIDSDEKNLKPIKMGEILSTQAAEILENAKIQNLDVDDKNLAEKIAAVDEKNLISGEKFEIDEKTLSWLASSAKIDDDDAEISNEDFAKMIDAAVEFIPGEETNDEKLESAQNLAATDPEFFLKNVENSEIVTENFANLSDDRIDFDKNDRKLSENSKEKKNDVKISVHDLRTRRPFETEKMAENAKIASDKIVQKSAEKKEINLSLQKQSDGNVAMTMELASRAEQNITSSNSQSAAAAGSDFQAMLSNAVQENAPDFVKAGSIILKDGNQGSINLIVRPEGLGNVKISLSLDDKNLSAQILVHTKEAMEAFKESIPSLKQAFTESGFETGSFDLNFSNNGSQQQGFAQGDRQNQEILANNTYGDFVTPKALAQDNLSDAYVANDYGINIVA